MSSETQKGYLTVEWDVLPSITLHTWIEADVTVITAAERGVRKPPKDGVSTGVMVGGTAERKIHEAMFEGLWASFKLHLIFIKLRNMRC
jgi:hypothetical protein